QPPPAAPPLPYTTLFRSIPQLPDLAPQARIHGQHRRRALLQRKIIRKLVIDSVSKRREGLASGDVGRQISQHTLAYLHHKTAPRSEEHTSELQSRENLVC